MQRSVEKREEEAGRRERRGTGVKEEGVRRERKGQNRGLKPMAGK